MSRDNASHDDGTPSSSSETVSVAGGAVKARLEVQRRVGDDSSWLDAGAVGLLGPDRPSSDGIPPEDEGRRDGNASAASAGRTAHRRSLPLPAKHILAPGARVKSDRKRAYLYRHSPDGVDTNLLIFLHGAGDSHVPYDRLGRTMALPQTATLSISASSCGDRAFTKLPFGLGYTWFDEMDYAATGEPLPAHHPTRVHSLRRAVEALERVLDVLLVSRRPRAEETTDGSENERESMTVWIPERVFLLGFSAGGCLAMELCQKWKQEGRMPLGGAVCVAGGVKSTGVKSGGERLYSTVSGGSDAKSGTPILIVAGSDDQVFTPSDARASSALYHGGGDANASTQSSSGLQLVQVYVKDWKGHGMVGSPEEMHAVMNFFQKQWCVAWLQWRVRMMSLHHEQSSSM